MGALIGGGMAITVATVLNNSEFNSVLLVPLTTTGFIVGAVNRYSLAIGVVACVLASLGWSYYQFSNDEYGGLAIVASFVSSLLFGPMIGGIWRIVRFGFGDSDD